MRFSALEETGTSGPKQEKTVSRSAGNAVLTFIAAEGVAVGMSFLASSSPKAAGIGMMAASPIPVIVVDDWRVGLTATGVLLGLGAYNRGLANSTDLTNKDILRRNIGAWQVGLATLGLVSYFSDRGAERRDLGGYF